LIWKGAAINSALFGWMYFCVLAFPGIVIRARRKRRGRCSDCGYDLRATPHGNCPECGTAIAKSD
jgi:rRNA maturation endonuclease Nob1